MVQEEYPDPMSSPLVVLLKYDPIVCSGLICLVKSEFKSKKEFSEEVRLMNSDVI